VIEEDHDFLSLSLWFSFIGAMRCKNLKEGSGSQERIFEFVRGPMGGSFEFVQIPREDPFSLFGLGFFSPTSTF